jgi:hypothetical protein
MANKRKNIVIISSEIPWGEGENNVLDTAYLQQLYSHHIVPLIAWKPWQKNSAGHSEKDTTVAQHILSGKYDSVILTFAGQIANLNKPIFLSLISKSDLNKYPLFNYADYTPHNFIAAWQYVYRLFKKAGADKVIWIWNTPDGSTGEDFFPGKNYVDWLGVNISNRHNGKLKNNMYSLDTIYRPYHSQQLFNSGLPVMLTENDGSLPNSSQWWDATRKTLDTAFTEIRALIVAPSDYNLLAMAPQASLPIDMDYTKWHKMFTKNRSLRLPADVKSIVYNKGYNWFRNRHTLGLKTMETDIGAMKKIGINTVERTMPGIYDHNLRKVLVSNKMNLIPAFWFLATPEVVDNDKQMQKQKEKILEFVRDNRDKKYIIAWNVGEDLLHNLSNQTYKPDYFHYRQKYIDWLSDVCGNIRMLDSIRPIIMDLHWDINGRSRFHYYKTHVPQINTYMLVADVKYKEGLKEPLEDGMAWGKIPVELWHLIPAIRQSGTIPAWQDVETTDFVKLNGLLDLEGRRKQWYKRVLNTWGNKSVDESPIPEIKILRPARVTVTNDRLTYHVLHKVDSLRWDFYRYDEKRIQFEWYLVRLDQYGNTMFIKQTGKGPSIELPIPAQPQYYKLYVEAIFKDEIKMVNTTLNTPLE